MCEMKSNSLSAGVSLKHCAAVWSKYIKCKRFSQCESQVLEGCTWLKRHCQEIPHMHKMQNKRLPFFFFLLVLQEAWNKLHHILPGQIDYLDVAGTVCALTLIYGRLLSRFAIHTARS